MASKFFAGVEGNQDRPPLELLPTNKRGGAPVESKYLFQIVEEGVEIRHSGDSSKHPGHPFVSYQAEVVEPEDFAGRSVFGLLYYPAELDAEATDKETENYNRQCQQFVGAIDAILGPGTAADIDGDDLETALAELVERLSGETFVGKVGVEKGKNGYAPKNKITYYYPADEWQGEGGTNY